MLAPGAEAPFVLSAMVKEADGSDGSADVSLEPQPPSPADWSSVRQTGAWAKATAKPGAAGFGSSERLTFAVEKVPGASSATTARVFVCVETLGLASPPSGQCECELPLIATAKHAVVPYIEGAGVRRRALRTARAWPWLRGGDCLKLLLDLAS